ncbi:MAG: branched-chain amino acid ABC transporter permease [Alphaproteobacteria bacterium]
MIAQRRIRQLTIGAIVWIAVSFALPALVGNIRILDFIVLGAILAIAAVGYDLLVGSCGMFALGQAGLMCIGAYATGYASVTWGLGPVEAAIFSIFLPIVATLFIGGPSLRLRGLYFGIATLVFAILVISIVNAWTDVTGGGTGLSGIPSLGGGTVIKVNYAFWIPFALLSLGAIFSALWLLNSSRVGDSWRAVARDEVLAANLGIDVFRTKMLAFVLSAACAGYAGFLFAYYLQFLSPDAFGMRLTISLLLMVYLGGAGSIWGPILGAFVVQGLLSFLPSDTDWFEAFYALIVLIVLATLPRGLAGAVSDGLDRLRQLGRKRLEVPVAKGAE